MAYATFIVDVNNHIKSIVITKDDIISPKTLFSKISNECLRDEEYDVIFLGRKPDASLQTLWRMYTRNYIENAMKNKTRWDPQPDFNA